MRYLYILSISFLTFIFVFESCEAPKSYPDIPEVKFKSVDISNATDTLGNLVKLVKLTISVVDGDGDIGIMADNGQIYPGFEDMDNKNLFIDLYEKIDGEFVKVDLLAPHYYGTPYLEPEGQDKTLKADLEVSISYSNQFFTYDTIRYDFYIYDRALHKSNIAESPEIPADTLGLIE